MVFIEMSKWEIRKSADEDSYFLLQKGSIFIWFQEVNIGNEYIKFYNRRVLTACYFKKMLPKEIVNDLKTLPQEN